MKVFFRNHGLTLVLMLFFSLSIFGQWKTGFRTYVEEKQLHGQVASENQWSYLRTGHFLSSVGENMESEFLQMALFVFLTRCFYQRGSAESKKFPEDKSSDEQEEELKEELYNDRQKRRHPFLWPLYEKSLTLALLALFVVFFLVHWHGSTLLINEERMDYGLSALTHGQVLVESEFWFESFQNWQSEFFSVAVLGVLSIFLRQYESPQSKKMNDENFKTGGS